MQSNVFNVVLLYLMFDQHFDASELNSSDRVNVHYDYIDVIIFMLSAVFNHP